VTTCVLAGGVGAARFLAGLLEVADPSTVTAVVNVGDDAVLHGLHVSPDLDTVTYTLAGAVNPETGWGLTGETWQAMESLAAYGGEAWFKLGDRDLGTHLYRTDRLAAGAPLSTVTAEIAARWDLRLRIVPVTDDRLRTMVTLDDGREVDFQTYFVGLQHDVGVSGLRFDADAVVLPAPGVLDAIRDAATVVIAPSNPFVSIGPLLAVPGVEDAVTERREDVVAVSPIVAGAALKGPADRLMADFGHEPSVVGIARIYAPLAGTLVVDEADAGLAGAVEAEGMRCIVTRTVMKEPGVAASLAEAVLSHE
jgi:LPPG:FO 2-phospho-L-lactate transferase